MSTQTIYSEGLTEEHGMAVNLYTDNKDLLKDRVPETKITAYTAANDDMMTKRSLADTAAEKKETLTKQEEAARIPVAGRIQTIKDATKKEYGRTSPEGKVLHVGDVHSDSTPVLVGWTSDYAKAFPNYQERLANQGVLPADITALQTDGAALEAINKKQEESKNDAAIATQAYNDSIDTMVKIADSIHNAAALAFTDKPEILIKFQAAKKLRYVAPPRKTKTPPPANPSSPDNTPPKA